MWRIWPWLTRTSRVALPPTSACNTQNVPRWFTRLPGNNAAVWQRRPGRSGPALGGLLRPSRRRRGRSPRRPGRSRRAGLGHPPAYMPRFVPGAAEQARPANRRRRGRPHVAWHRGRPGGRRGLTRDGRALGTRPASGAWAKRARRAGCQRRADEHPDWLLHRSLGVHVRLGRGRGRCRRADPHDRGYRHDQQQDHECQAGFEYLIQHRQTQVSHSSFLSRPVAGFQPRSAQPLADRTLAARVHPAGGTLVCRAIESQCVLPSRGCCPHFSRLPAAGERWE